MDASDKQWIEENVPEEKPTSAVDELAILKGLREIYQQNREILELLREGTNNSPKQTDKMCSEHGVAMASAVSKKTGKPYAFHKNEDNQICFGRGYQS